MSMKEYMVCEMPSDTSAADVVSFGTENFVKTPTEAILVIVYL